MTFSIQRINKYQNYGLPWHTVLSGCLPLIFTLKVNIPISIKSALLKILDQFDRENNPFGPHSVPGQKLPGIGSWWIASGSHLTLRQVIIWSGTKCGPKDSFPGQFDLEFLRVCSPRMSHFLHQRDLKGYLVIDTCLIGGNTLYVVWWNILRFEIGNIGVRRGVTVGRPWQLQSIWYSELSKLILFSY